MDRRVWGLGFIAVLSTFLYWQFSIQFYIFILGVAERRRVLGIAARTRKEDWGKWRFLSHYANQKCLSDLEEGVGYSVQDNGVGVFGRIRRERKKRAQNSAQEEMVQPLVMHSPIAFVSYWLRLAVIDNVFSSWLDWFCVMLVEIKEPTPIFGLSDEVGSR